MEYIWETTTTSYKIVLKDWHSSTGGGSWISSMYEGWSDAKLNEFDMDIETYDNTNVETRPAVLVPG